MTAPRGVCEWTFEATPASVPRLRAAVAEHLSGNGVSPDLVDSVRLGVSEAVTNVVLHAYIDDGVCGDMGVNVEMDDDSVTVTVRDAGRGMVPRHDSPGAGLGLAIIAQIASSVEIAHQPDRGTQLKMTFAR